MKRTLLVVLGLLLLVSQSLAGDSDVPRDKKKKIEQFLRTAIIERENGGLKKAKITFFVIQDLDSFSINFITKKDVLDFTEYYVKGTYRLVMKTTEDRTYKDKSTKKGDVKTGGKVFFKTVVNEDGFGDLKMRGLEKEKVEK